MFDVAMLATGILFGLSIAAPVGPIGVLCIRQTLAGGPVLGFATGLGAAVADGCYGLVAALGVAAIAGLLAEWDLWLRIGGGLLLIWLAIAIWRAPPPQKAPNLTGRGLFAAFAATFALTLTNPATILSFAAIFGSIGARAVAGGAALPIVVGVFLGSALWWLFLSSLVALVRHRLSAAAITWINRGSAAMLAGFGLVAIASTLR